MSMHLRIVCLILGTILTIGSTKTPNPNMSTESTSTTTSKATPSSTEKHNEVEKINLRILHTLETSRTGHIIGNMEFEHYTAILRHALDLESRYLYLKSQAYHKFINYNSLRLKLEADLESRIAVIESLLHGKTTEKCKQLYKNQKKAKYGN